MSILIVDDSNTVLHVVAKILTELGYTDIRKANSPDDARVILEGADQAPDLIISDWNMKGGTGLDLLRYVRGNSKIASKPFILLTSDHDRTKIMQAREYAPQFYLLKPCSKKIMQEKLLILSRTHGIPAPKGADGAPLEPAGPPETQHKIESELVPEISSNQGGSKGSDSANILKQVVYLLSDQITAEQFNSYLASELFEVPVEEVSLSQVMKVIEKLHETISEVFRSALANRPSGKYPF